MVYTEEMTTSEILLRLASMRNELLQAVDDIEKISKNICYKAEQTEPSLEQFRVGLEYHTDAMHFGKAKGKSITTDKTEQTEPQRDMAEDIVRSYGFKAESYQQAKAKDEPQYDAEEVAKDINRRVDMVQKAYETMSCQECKYWTYDTRWGWFCPLKGQDECKYKPKQTEP